jgi:hypothetical protein
METTKLSPWSKWVTSLTFGMDPTFMMPMLDPSDGLEYIIVGDSSGNLYKLEGTTGGGDGGDTAVVTNRTSGLLSSEAEGEIFDIEGWVKYKDKAAVSLTLDFMFSGMHNMTNVITIAIPSGSSNIKRQPFGVPGQSTDVQIKTAVSDVDDFLVSEVGFRWSEVDDG